MNTVRQIRELNKKELEAGISPQASWHVDYRDTAYVCIRGLPFDLSEGDIITIFSQFGEPVYINLVRDKETGKSKGLCFLKYEDQRSCDLAVDNLCGATIMGRTLMVDHKRYERKDGEEEWDNTLGDAMPPVVNDEESEERPMLKEERELLELMRDHDDDDPMKKYLIEQKKEDVEVALERYRKKEKSGGEKKRERSHHHSTRRRHRDRSRSDSRDRDHRSSRRRSRSKNRERVHSSDDAKRRRRSPSDSREKPKRHDRERQLR